MEPRLSEATAVSTPHLTPNKFVAASTEGAKFPSIERLRGLAILLTVAVHLNYDFYALVPEFLRETWAGVHLFFVISGFLVARSLLLSLPDLSGLSWTARWEKARVPVTAFFLRRFFRIMPAAMVVVGVVLAGAVVSTILTRNTAIIRDHLIESVALFGGFYNYAVGPHLTRYLGPFWSLTVEEHFYLALPFLALALHKKRQRLLLCVGMIAFIALVVRPLTGVVKANWIHDLPMRKPTHLACDFLFLGMLLFLMRNEKFADKPFVSKLTMQVLAVISAVILFTVTAIYPVENAAHPTPASTFFVLLLCTSFLVYCGTLPTQDVISASIFNRPLEWLGGRCYALYLTHFPVILYTDKILYRVASEATLSAIRGSVLLQLAVFAVQFTLMAVVSEALYRLVEKPWNRYGRTLSDQLLRKPLAQ